MKEELAKNLNTFLEKTLETIDQTQGFVQSEIPGAMKQLLQWHFLEGIIRGSVAIMACLIFAILFYVCIKKAKQSVNEELKCLACIIFSISSFIGTCILFPISLDYFMHSIQIHIAPKVWIIEYIRTFLN